MGASGRNDSFPAWTHTREADTAFQGTPNNISERQLRRQAVGRKNWIFLGSNDGAAVNTTFSTLIASCHLHDIEPEAYLREVICLLPDWPKSRILDLAPCNWQQTRQKPEAQQLLAENLWLTFLDIVDRSHSQTA